MDETEQTSNTHSPRLDEQLEQEQAREASTAEWDAPGHDGVVGPDDRDPDRRDVRAEIGKYVSLTRFPATAEDLTALATANGAPEEVTQQLRDLPSGDTFADARQVWEALGLESEDRF